jgi:hypothetical protein
LLVAEAGSFATRFPTVDETEPLEVVFLSDLSDMDEVDSLAEESALWLEPLRSVE